MNSTKCKHAFLVVDDEPNVLDSVYNLLRREYQVYRANNADDAYRLLREEDIQIVLSDQRMPGITGVDLLRKVREDHPDVVRMIFTGYADIQVVVAAINDGQVFRYLTKPWNPDELKAVVRQASEYYDLVSERKRLIAELETRNAELKEAVSLKSAFLDIASHELSTPVNIVLGMADLLSSQPGPPEAREIQQFIRAVKTAAQRLDRIVENMLKLLQADTFTVEPECETIQCKTLFERLREQVLPFLQDRRQKLSIEVTPPDLEVCVDVGKMHDVIVNLVVNAIKFSPDESTVTVVARSDSSASIIEVLDDGIGISERDLSHVFEPFFTSFNTMTHSSGTHEYCRRGMGMGLAIVKKFVELHGASLVAQRREPRGMAFSIRIPAEQS